MIYETVWFQLLQLVVGSSAVSLGILLGTYMGGMCIGSLLLPRCVPVRTHPLRVYAIIECGIGVCGLLVLLTMPLLDHLYAAIGGSGLFGFLLRALIAAVCLFPPTLLLGASLPAIARYVESSPRRVSWLGYFYGGNIAGAVFGCLFAGFYLLRVYDMPTATYVAAAINVVVAALSYRLSTRTHYEPTPPGDSPAREASPPATQSYVYVAIGLSGLTALGAEVVWTRLLSVMLGATVYTFSIVLAVFLGGLGVGSGLGSHLARQMRNPRVALGVCQLLLAAAIAGPLTHWPMHCPTGRSIHCWPAAPFSTFRSTSCAACGRSFPPHVCGVRAFRSRWPPPRSAAKIPGPWPAGCTPSTPSAEFSEPSPSASS